MLFFWRGARSQINVKYQPARSRRPDVLNFCCVATPLAKIGDSRQRQATSSRLAKRQDDNHVAWDCISTMCVMTDPRNTARNERRHERQRGGVIASSVRRDRGRLRSFMPAYFIPNMAFFRSSNTGNFREHVGGQRWSQKGI